MLANEGPKEGVIFKSFPVHGSGFIRVMQSEEERKNNPFNDDIFYHVSKFVSGTNLEDIVVNAKVRFNIIFNHEFRIF